MEGAPKFDKTGEGWRGDFKNGDRPEGYTSLTQRYILLKRDGYSESEALGVDFVAEHNELMGKAKAGALSQPELERFLELNTKRSEAMDRFEDWYKTKPSAA